MRRAAAAMAVAAVAVGGLAGCTASSSPSARQTGSGGPSHRGSTSGSASPSVGTPTDAWALRHASRSHDVEGFADQVSVEPGQHVRLFVSTRAAGLVVRAFRLGEVDGRQALLVWTSHHLPGLHQPAGTPSGPTRTVETQWSPTTDVDTTGWPTGDYLFRLDADDGSQSYVPLTVRRPSVAGTIVIVNAVTTWQAYNTWGCCSLYAGGNGAFATRSRAVSFDRPYDKQNGAGQFLTRELPLVFLAERTGLRLSYVTDVDLDADPHVLDGATAVVSPGHDEYWSAPMRRVVTAARDAGSNLAWLGANSVFRRIRFAASRLGPRRVEINYKVAAEDPVRDSVETTADWPAPPHADPESSLLGEQYGCFPGHDEARVAGVVVDPASWLFAGSGAHSGTSLPHLVGPEVDAVQPGFPMPATVEVLLHSPVHCPGGHPSHQDTTYYVAASGAGVFDAGTIDWVCQLGRPCVAPSATTRTVSAVTANLLRAFATPRAGRSHPATDNRAALGIR